MVGGWGKKNTTALGIFLYRQTVLGGIICNRQSVESLMTSAEFRELALMTSEDFDGRLHTYTIGIKLELGPNLHVCNSIARGPRTGPRPIRERLSVNKLGAVGRPFTERTACISLRIQKGVSLGRKILKRNSSLLDQGLPKGGHSSTHTGSVPRDSPITITITIALAFAFAFAWQRGTCAGTR